MDVYLGQPVELRCPKCRARVPLLNDACTCLRCGHREVVHGYTPKDLYYQTTVRGQWLWAYNRAHLVLMLRYIAALQRSHVAPRHQHGFAGRFHKLPRKLVSAKNRPAVVRAITRLLHD